MIKDIAIFVLFVLLIGGIHFGLSSISDMLLFDNNVILGYAVLIILSVIGSSVFYLENKIEDLSFPQAFMIVTTVQLLAAMSFAAYLRYTITTNMRTILLQFVVEFILFVAVQSIYLIKTKAQKLN